MDNKQLEVFDCVSDGYLPLVRFGGWRVATLNYCEDFNPVNFHQVERHNETDEVFVLLTGEATLIIGEQLEKVPMEKGKVYNVRQGVWHHIWVSRDAQVLIVENLDTATENSDYKAV